MFKDDKNILDQTIKRIQSMLDFTKPFKLGSLEPIDN